MKYQQLDQEERFRIAALRIERLGVREIARRLGRSAATISREVRRNAYPTDGHYRPAHADKMARGRRKRSRKGTRFSLKDWRQVEGLIQQDFSPEQVSGFLKRREELSISHETIYAYVWRDKQAGGHLHVHLRGANKKRRKRYGRNDSRRGLRRWRNASSGVTGRPTR